MVFFFPAIALMFFFFWFVLRRTVSPEYERYKKQNPGKWL